MNLPLVECFVEVLAETETLRAGLSTRPFVPAEHLDTLREGLDQAVGRARAAGHGPGEVDLARFAVCAWIDEVLMDLACEQAPLTRNTGLLQRRYYDTADAGVLFFKYMEEHAGAHRELMEVFQLCLSLGFRGARDPASTGECRDVTPDRRQPLLARADRVGGTLLRRRYQRGMTRLLISCLLMPLLLYLTWTFMDAAIADAVLALSAAAGEG